LLWLENWFLFHPTTFARGWADPPAGLGVRDVELEGPGGVALHAWWSAPPGWKPADGAVLYCHGNAGNLSHRGAALQAWRSETGLAVLIFDYPGYGKSGGRPTEAGLYAAADAAYAWLTDEAKVRGEDVVLYGGSLGAAVAVDLAARHP